ncbi:hypothetical protein [Nocardioides dokdonensis]|uniref:hypothetical protein n=1 Tax=Nocardioides dokdonensis TaxID=450734 RepID=UPI0012F769DD|nr:hypothetical protein [Nocardioides dokdonensis]
MRGPDSDSANNNLAFAKTGCLDLSGADIRVSVGIGYDNGPDNVSKIDVLRAERAAFGGDVELEGEFGVIHLAQASVLGLASFGPALVGETGWNAHVTQARALAHQVSQMLELLDQSDPEVEIDYVSLHRRVQATGRPDVFSRLRDTEAAVVIGELAEAAERPDDPQRPQDSEARRVRLRGSLRLIGAQLQDLGLEPGVSGRTTVSLDLRDSNVRSLELPLRRHDGVANLDGAIIGTLHVATREGGEPASMRLDPTINSWQVERLRNRPVFVGRGVPSAQLQVPPLRLGSAAGGGGAGLLGWMPQGTRTVFWQQPWHVLAASLDAEGREWEARGVRILAADKHKRAVAAGHRLGSGRMSRLRATLSEAGRRITWATIGHGYSSFRAIWLLLACLVATWAVTAAGQSAGAFEPTTDEAPGLWWFLYGLDITLSPVGTGQYDAWQSSVFWLALSLWTLKLVSWTLFGLFLSGVSGRVTRSQGGAQ